MLIVMLNAIPMTMGKFPLPLYTIASYGVSWITILPALLCYEGKCTSTSTGSIYNPLLHTGERMKRIESRARGLPFDEEEVHRQNRKFWLFMLSIAVYGAWTIVYILLFSAVVRTAEPYVVVT